MEWSKEQMITFLWWCCSFRKDFDFINDLEILVRVQSTIQITLCVCVSIYIYTHIYKSATNLPVTFHEIGRFSYLIKGVEPAAGRSFSIPRSGWKGWSASEFEMTFIGSFSFLTGLTRQTNYHRCLRLTSVITRALRRNTIHGLNGGGGNKYKY